MRKLIIAFMFFLPIVVLPANELNELDTDKPIYQKRWGGTVIAWPVGDVEEVRIPDDPKTRAQAELKAEIERIKADTENYKRKLNEEADQRADGHFWIKAGAGLFVLGAFMFVALMKWGVESFGIAGAALGLCSICYGALVVKLAGMETIIFWGVGAS